MPSVRARVAFLVAISSGVNNRWNRELAKFNTSPSQSAASSLERLMLPIQTRMSGLLGSPK